MKPKFKINDLVRLSKVVNPQFCNFLKGTIGRIKAIHNADLNFILPGYTVEQKHQTNFFMESELELLKRA